MERSMIAVFLALLLSAHIVVATEEIATMDGMSPVMEGMSSSSSSPTIKLILRKITSEGEQKLVKIKLTKINDSKPVILDDLKEVHTQKIHLLIVDSGLTDYIHVHPKPSGNFGVYDFLWKPQTKNNYRIWADLVPVTSGKEEFAMADISQGKKLKTKIDKSVFFNSSVDGVNFKLSFNTDKIIVGRVVIGKIIVTDDQDKPVTDLQVLMGTFGHVVCFGEDFTTIMHIHPMGPDPIDAAALGGPEIDFHFEPTKAGFVKLFAQILLKGKEVYAPFGLMVYKA